MLRKIKRILFTSIALIRVGTFKKKPFVNGFTRFTKKTNLGSNCHFNGLRVHGYGRCIIGDNFHSGYGCAILTSYHNFNGNKIPYDNTNIIRDVVIEDNVWLGINVTILAGVTIGEGAIIQAGSIITKDIPPLAIAGNPPATVFKSRDKELYYKLKEEQRFN